MKRMIAALFAVLVFAGPASAAKQVYSLSLDQAQPVSSSVTFTATRSVARSGPRIEWVNVYCHSSDHVTIYDTELPVSWGTFDSRVGRAGPFDLAAGSNHCWAALVTTVDYEPQNGDPEVFFVVTQ